MTNQITKFDSSTLMNAVRDRIKATFVGMIPEDQWMGLCQQVVDDFFRVKDQYYTSHHRTSDFQQICREELSRMAKEKIVAYLTSCPPDGWTDDGQPKAHPLLKQMITENAAEIFSALFAGMAQKLVEHIRSGHYS